MWPLAQNLDVNAIGRAAIEMYKKEPDLEDEELRSFKGTEWNDRPPAVLAEIGRVRLDARKQGWHDTTLQILAAMLEKGDVIKGVSKREMLIVKKDGSEKTPIWETTTPEFEGRPDRTVDSDEAHAHPLDLSPLSGGEWKRFEV